MGEGKYRLQSVMDARERAKREAARLVALRRGQLEDAEEELASRVAAVGRCRRQQRDARAKMLAEGERVRAPKGRQHPYGRYYKQVAVPDPLRRVRFCLGVVKGDAETKTTRGTRVLTSLQAVASQELLCSETKELN